MAGSAERLESCPSRAVKQRRSSTGCIRKPCGPSVGDGIYFFTKPDEKGHSDLSVYEFATGKIRKILTIERPVTWRIEVSRDGRTILYTQVDEAGSDLMLVENFR